MSSRGEGSNSTADRKVTKETASVIPVGRKLVKTMVLKTIISAFTIPCGNDQGSEPAGDGNGYRDGGRVHPSR
ncbi:unnamed protein product [Eruca vesicaria subsp. sativa]|uniref:Uncharacterized protein n=1 Tax=Eruca vesicaria subsp. sativa TaxID=29727 RepID=A0ABC8KP35_ERUVS|nr:unnamed protein product [Eruca vesicaria subsp. sativa]